MSCKPKTRSDIPSSLLLSFRTNIGRYTTVKYFLNDGRPYKIAEMEKNILIHCRPISNWLWFLCRLTFWNIFTILTSCKLSESVVFSEPSLILPTSESSQSTGKPTSKKYHWPRNIIEEIMGPHWPSDRY